MNLNKVFLGGNLTRDVELKATQGGTSVASFGLAINRKWKDAGGADKEEVTFVDCTAWGKTGEAIAKFFGKGKPIFIEGRLKLDQWEDKEGGKRSKLSAVVESFQFCGGKDAPESPSAKPTTARPGARQAAPQAPIESDDIPF